MAITMQGIAVRFMFLKVDFPIAKFFKQAGSVLEFLLVRLIVMYEKKQWEIKSYAGESVNGQLTSSNDEVTLDDELESIQRSASDHSGTVDAAQQEQHMQRVENCRKKERSLTTKKTKVDWNPDLHRLFVQTVEELGLEKAIPSRILEIMGVESLTRHNVASHLQKYRAQRKRKRAESKQKCSSLEPLNKRDCLHIQPSPSIPSTCLAMYGDSLLKNSISAWQTTGPPAKHSRNANKDESRVRSKLSLPMGLKPPMIAGLIEELRKLAQRAK
ncbi:hypothetical protein SELMODRAFT_402806 [Selaginella moellendorffii]|uniref:HTH myb-type domain-containing protein n=1 Tax=Selaginella moellendorffii TaxID=88036 RepID=D8QN41_SELML|nr:hypothetical protein SELMODRAFT_402806 [Selaginella moellendorffii]